MVSTPTVDELYASAAKFAQSALDAHHKDDHQRVAIDVGTSLEHLTKACLANRSPAFLVELKPGNWESLAQLCGHSQPHLKQLRTVGLVEPANLPAFVQIAWPQQPTVIDPTSFGESASALVRMFAQAHIELAHIKSRRPL
jgi:hypothetical protein